MKVQYFTTIAGPDSTKNANQGDVRDVSPAEAKELIAAGIAKPIGSEPAETAEEKPKAEKRGKAKANADKDE